ncbi:unnamed protein product [Rotaria socialis]|uniref:c-SKI SMAD4-binding domain-containing protein n=1 Tax=Rotaria socialis TaxID=392032 RepID=A0A817RXM1_9BILA|nr:unnamed protein product [Rotaria socialis]CAF4243174.1 unnamed protein product [Rotaria socialis]
MIKHASNNRIFEQLTIFSSDYHKKQQHQQHYNETDINLASDQHDKNFQSDTKEENIDPYAGNHLISSPVSTDNIDEPLIIVLDEDETNVDDDYEQSNIITTTIDSKENLTRNEQYKTNYSQDKQSINKSKRSLNFITKSITNSKSIRSTRKRRSNRLLNDRTHKISNKFIRTFFLPTNFMRQTYLQQNRSRLIARRKNSHKHLLSSTMSNSTNSKSLSINENSYGLSSNDSILSNISFDNIASILTISRMGSIFYCLEDLYLKVFSSLCTLDEFINLLLKSESIMIKQVTLSEKISIEQQIPSLKKSNDTRYRLISINSSSYLNKLRQLLVTFTNLNENENQQREKNINQIIDEMRSYRQTPTPVLLKDKVLHLPMTTKRLSSGDDDAGDEHNDEPRKRLKIVTKKPKPNETPSLAPTQFGIFIQCNGPVSCNIFSTNETVSSTTTATSAETTTTTTTTSTSTVATTESEIISKSTIIKQQNDSTQHMHFDKLHQQYQQTVSRFNLNNEQTTQTSMNVNRLNSYDPTDGTPINKLCSSSSSSSSLSASSSVMNMPKKWRILNSYNNDINDTSSASKVHLPTSSTNYSRCLYRSKSFTYRKQQNKSLVRRSSSLSLVTCNKKENVSIKNLPLVDSNTKLNTKTPAEAIDLTDESFSMPMIVNVEENVEPANQRHKIKCKKPTLTSKPNVLPNVPVLDSTTRTPSNIVSRSIPYGPNNPAMLTKPTPLRHPVPPSPYRSSSYGVYHQESYIYRDQSQNIPQPSNSLSHYHPPTSLNNGNPYVYPFSSSMPYPTIKKQKEMPTTNSYDMQQNSHSLIYSSPSNNNNNHHNNNHHMSSSLVMPIVRKPNYYHQLTPEQQVSIKMQASPPTSLPCRLPCCFPQPPVQAQHSTDKLTPNERLIYRQYAVPTSTAQTFKREPSQTPDAQNLSSSMNRRQRRIDSVPPQPSTTPYSHYPSPKPYFVPPPPPSSFSSSSSSSSSNWPSAPPPTSNPNMNPSMRYPYPPLNTPMNGMTTRKMEPYPQPRRPTPLQSRAPPTTSIVAQNSSILISPPNTPHELTLPNVRARSIDLQRAIAERGYCDMDKLPKLVVRHTKTYSNKSVDTMGQLFPTWFNEPDYRCIHCFRCDQVFTPQQFMTHVDDELMLNEQPLNMTSIQLLPSEKMSEYKVGLWNQFCTNLTTYARDGRIGGFSTNRNV